MRNHLPADHAFSDYFGALGDDETRKRCTYDRYRNEKCLPGDRDYEKQVARAVAEAEAWRVKQEKKAAEAEAKRLKKEQRAAEAAARRALELVTPEPITSESAIPAKTLKLLRFVNPFVQGSSASSDVKQLLSRLVQGSEVAPEPVAIPEPSVNLKRLAVWGGIVLTGVGVLALLFRKGKR